MNMHDRSSWRFRKYRSLSARVPPCLAPFFAGPKHKNPLCPPTETLATRATLDPDWLKIGQQEQARLQDILSSRINMLYAMK